MPGDDIQLTTEQIHVSSRLKLAVALEHVPTRIPEMEGVGRQGRSAPQQIAEGHSIGTVAEALGGGAAGRQVVYIESARPGDRRSQEERTGERCFHFLIVCVPHLTATHPASNGSGLKATIDWSGCLRVFWPESVSDGFR